MNNIKIFSNLALFSVALIWGLSFVAQKAGMDYIEPFSFNFIRSILGGLSLIPVIFIAKLIRKDTRPPEIKHKQHIDMTIAGLACGTALFAAMSIQQYCMPQATAGKAGFVTALYIIFVPLILAFFGKNLSKKIIISIALALAGLYLLCFKNDSGGFGLYDILLLAGAFFYAVHIITVNYFSQKTNPVKVSCFQFFAVGILSIPPMIIFETPKISGFIACAVPILFAGVITCGIAYTLQIFGQKYTRPVTASLIFCLESVFAVLGGCIILHEAMSVREIFGCILMIGGVILSQIDSTHSKVQNVEPHE